MIALVIGSWRIPTATGYRQSILAPDDEPSKAALSNVFEKAESPAADAATRTPALPPTTLTLSETIKSEPAEQTLPGQPQVAVARPPASIWRQPGEGLQGGGRGGVEGESIPLDTREPKYQDYFNKVREQIKASRVPRSVSRSWTLGASP